jgi:hypothetical protein
MYKCSSCSTKLTSKNWLKFERKSNRYWCSACRRQYYRDKDQKNRDVLIKKFGSKKCVVCKEPLTIKNTSIRTFKKNDDVCKKCSAKRCQLKLRQEILLQYGNKCICCGETTPEFLTIDHINGRSLPYKKTFESGNKLYSVLRKLNYPKDNYQLLCWNCNCSKGRYGQCPHQKESK